MKKQQLICMKNTEYLLLFNYIRLQWFSLLILKRQPYFNQIQNTGLLISKQNLLLLFLSYVEVSQKPNM